MKLGGRSQQVSRGQRAFALPPSALLVIYAGAVGAPVVLTSLAAGREAAFWRWLNKRR
jgi:hypothetical protein